MTYNLCYFLGNKAFVINFLETGLLCCVCICGLPGKICLGKINIPHQNPNWPITPICLVCCCYPPTNVDLVRNSRVKNSLKETLQRETQYNKPG